jgi:perosamine synthetase
LGIPIIENCAVGLGAKYKNRKIGTFGDVSVFSFNATKLLTTAKGGAIFSKNADLIENLRELTDILRKSQYRIKFNYRLSDLQAALGITQLKKVEEFIYRRKKIADEYNTIVDRKTHAKRIKIPSHKDCVWYRYIIISDKDPDIVNKRFSDNRITTINPLENWELLHNRVGLKRDRFPNAEKMTGKTVSIPIFPSLNGDEINKIKSTIDMIY